MRLRRGKKKTKQKKLGRKVSSTEDHNSSPTEEFRSGLPSGQPETELLFRGDGHNSCHWNQ